MKLHARLSLALSLMLLAGAAAQADCVYPQAPQNLPNGATATKEEMLSAQASVKEYSKAVQEVYLPCLEAAKAETISTLDAASPEYANQKSLVEAMHAKKHNAALDELQVVADRWGEEIKAFNAAPKK